MTKYYLVKINFSFLFTRCTVWKNEKFTVTHKKISSNQLISIFFSKNVTFTKVLSKKCDSKWEIHCHSNFFSSNQFRVKFSSKKLLSQNFCKKVVAVKSRSFHTMRCELKIKPSLIFDKITWNQLFLLIINHSKVISRNIFQIPIYSLFSPFKLPI